jgi:polysaccharide export outer membrane protein
MVVLMMRSLLSLATLVLCCFLQAALAQEAVPLPEDYRVNPGDTLDISVWKEEDLQREILVRPDGGFSFPLAGDMVAKGKTVTEIRDELAARLSRYIPDLVITVTVVDVEGNRIFVIGQVTKAGAFVMNPQLDVVQALALAGGMTPFASLKNIRILRRENGRQRAIRFDYTEVSEGESLDQNIVLQSGDVVIVP